ncbi:MAG: hypothetical protein ACFFCS_10440 [Candidatus Hodarchaeota archaeon]
MPSIGHFMIGLFIVIPILYYDKEKFNPKVAAIFVLNNWIGTDAGQTYSKLLISPFEGDISDFLQDMGFVKDMADAIADSIAELFHYVVPYLAFAILLAFFYSYMSRFSIVKGEKFLNIVDDGKKTLNVKNAYLLCVSGGLLHTITDSIFRKNTKIKILNSIFEPVLYDRQEGDERPLGLPPISEWGQLDTGATVIVMYILVVLIIFLSIYIVKRSTKEMILLLGIFAGAILIVGFTIGFGEMDVGVLFIFGLFVFLPLLLLFHVARDVRDKPLEREPRSGMGVEKGILVAAVVSLLLSVIILALGTVAIIMPDVIDSIIGVGVATIIILGVGIAGVGGILLIGSIGLFKRVNVCRQIVRYLYIPLIILVFPLIITFYLSEENIKKEFIER